MVEPRQSAMQRIQVGLVGLVVVLLFVSLANMVLDRVTGDQSVNEVPGVAENKAEATDEPLAELGVTPVASEGITPAVETPPSQTNNAGQQPAGTRR